MSTKQQPGKQIKAALAPHLEFPGLSQRAVNLLRGHFEVSMEIIDKMEPIERIQLSIELSRHLQDNPSLPNSPKQKPLVHPEVDFHCTLSLDDIFPSTVPTNIYIKLTLSSFLFFLSCSEKNPPSTPFVDDFKQSLVVDIKSVAGKSPTEVKSVFGAPYKTKKSPKDCATLNACNLELQFKKGSITVLFNDNRALWFEFDNLDTLQWRNKPEIFGLPNTSPSKSTKYYDWYDSKFPGIKRIAFIPSKKYLDCIGYAIVEAE